jgi:hypothetical protein
MVVPEESGGNPEEKPLNLPVEHSFPDIALDDSPVAVKDHERGLGTGWNRE